MSVIPHGTLSLPGGTRPGRTKTGQKAYTERTILAFGKIKPYKGTDLLIEAFALLPRELRSQARLRIVGEPYMPLEPLQARARELGIADRGEWDARYVRDDEIGGILEGADIL